MKIELDELEKRKVIIKELEHTNWVSNILFVQKKGTTKKRCCIDPAALNQELKKNNLEFPTVDKILSELRIAKIFSITVDASKGLWQF